MPFANLCKISTRIFKIICVQFNSIQVDSSTAEVTGPRRQEAHQTEKQIETQGQQEMDTKMETQYNHEQSESVLAGSAARQRGSMVIMVAAARSQPDRI